MAILCGSLAPAVERESEYNAILAITAPGTGGHYGGKNQTRIYTKSADSEREIWKLEDVLYQAIELDGLDNQELLVQVLVNHGTEAMSYIEFLLTPEIVRTKEPSRYVDWGNIPPNIFAIDRARSRLHWEF